MALVLSSGSSTLFAFLVLFSVTVTSGRYHHFEEDVTLTKDQKNALDKYKERMVPIVPNEYMKEDIFLMRWLRSKNFNVKKAETALLQDLQWREENRMDTISEEDWSDFDYDYKVWNEGQDKRGKPILYFEVATHDTRKAVISGKAERYIRYTNKCFEETTTVVRDLGTKYGNVTRGHLWINMDGYNLSIHGCLQCIPILIRMVLNSQQHYPGIVDQIILVNAPSMVEPLLNTVKAVSPELSIQVFGTNKNFYKQRLSEEFDFDQLPPSVGGTKFYKGMEEDLNY